MLFSERPPTYASSCMTIFGGRTEQHVITGFGELVAVETLKSDTSLPPVNRTSEIEHHWVMGRKKKNIEMFGSFTEPFNFSRKLQIFPTRILTASPAKGFPLEFFDGGGTQKLEWFPYQNVKKCDDMSISIDTYWHWADRRIGKTISRSACIVCWRAIKMTVWSQTHNGGGWWCQIYYWLADIQCEYCIKQ